jgi:hypothetical protein
MKGFEAADIDDMLKKLVAHAHKDDPFTVVPYMLTFVSRLRFPVGNSDLICCFVIKAHCTRVQKCLAGDALVCQESVDAICVWPEALRV